MANNKVQLGDGTVLLDLTGDTVAPQTLLSGATAHNAAGEKISGSVVTAPASTTTPKAPGTADAGSEDAYARGDHVHPTDTTRQPKITAKGILKGDGAGGVSGGAVEKNELADDVQKSLDKADASVQTTGGTMTGDLKVGLAALGTNGYVKGTWLQATENNHMENKSAKVAVFDGSGWVYYRTPAEILSDIGAAKSSHNHEGRLIQPTSIELFPGTSAGHGGYIDFHFNSDAADFTSRIYEPAKGVLKYNGYGIVSTANIIALYNVHVSFSNGVFEYSNAAIKTTSVCFAQFRGSAVSSGFQDTVLGVTSYAGKLRIIAKNGGTFETDVNILIVNL